MYEGVTQAGLSEDRSRLDPVKDFYSESHRTIIRRIGHRTVCMSNDRFFFSNDIDASVQAFDELNDLMMPVKNISQVIPLDPTHYWIIGTDISILISDDKGKAELIKAVGCDHKYNETGDDSQTIVPLDDATIMICMNNGFILSDKFRNQPVTHHKQLFIDKVEAKLKSGEIISIPLEGNSLPKLPANLTSIRISVGYPCSPGVDRFYPPKLTVIATD